jgi:hypothetical protein
MPNPINGISLPMTTNPSLGVERGRPPVCRLLPTLRWAGDDNRALRRASNTRHGNARRCVDENRCHGWLRDDPRGGTLPPARNAGLRVAPTIELCLAYGESKPPSLPGVKRWASCSRNPSPWRFES